MQTEVVRHLEIQGEANISDFELAFDINVDQICV